MTSRLSGAVCVLLFSFISMLANNVQAAPVLVYDGGDIITCIAGLGTPPDNCTIGTETNPISYFASDSNGNGSFEAGERTDLDPGPDGGVLVGTIQPASGSHSGCPNGTESPGLDAAWCFFGNTGVFLTTTAVTVVDPDVNNDGGFTKTLDFTGFAVDWNTNPVASLGGDPASFPSDTGQATLTCSIANCPPDSAFTLDYVTHGDPNSSSFFGNGTFHSVHLEGTIGIPSTYSESSQSAGISFQSETNGMAAGIAWIDYDNDTWPDLFIPSIGAPNRLFHNDGGGLFTEVGATANVQLIGRSSLASAIGDYDGDGFDDIFVVNDGTNTLLRNTGDGSFEDITSTAGLDDVARSGVAGAAAFGDLNGDGYLDLYTGKWFVPVSECERSDLYINNGDGTFTNRTVEAGVENVACTFDVPMTDFDADGDLDILAVNDVVFGTFLVTTLYRNDGPNVQGVPQFVVSNNGINVGLFTAMGAAIGDYDNDLDLDYYTTQIGAGVLSTNDGSGNFSVSTLQFDDDWGWGAVFFDSDNDGFLDLYRGNSPAGGGNPIQENMFFYNNGDGTLSWDFHSAGLESDNAGLGIAAADYDRDGDIDLAVHGLLGDVNLFRNDTVIDHHWLKVRLNGLLPNHRGIGAIVTLHTTDGVTPRSQMREIHSGSGHGSTHEFTAHFGMGYHTQVNSLSVQWPSSCTQFVPVPVGIDTEIMVDETGCVADTDGDGIPDSWEIQNGLNPNDSADAALDSDSDGLNNLGEYTNGTDPNNTDSDNDLWSDGNEVARGTDPGDADSFPYPPVLVFDAAVFTGSEVTGGSYFASDSNGDGSFQTGERTGLAPGPDGGVLVGSVQPAADSHSSCPNGTESPGLDASWCFFGNTGVFLTTTAATVVDPDVNNDGGFTKTLDFTGFAVDWNTNPVASLGGDPANFPSDTGQATLSCSIANCQPGSAFTLDYVTHGDPNSSAFFGNGTFHSVHLEGTIAVSTVADGDLNLDGFVNTVDVLLGSRIIAGNFVPSPEQFLHGDVAPLQNGVPVPDGIINVADLLLIQRKATGLAGF